MPQEETRDKGKHHFHYSREERLNADSAIGRDDREEGSGGKGLFRRNRSLAIILLDIVVIVIMFIIFQFVFTPGRSASRVSDYRVELDAFRFENEVYATVEITRIREREQVESGAESLVEIRIGDSEEILDVLPLEVGAKTTATAVLPWVEDEPVTVELQFPGESLELSSIPKE